MLTRILYLLCLPWALLAQEIPAVVDGSWQSKNSYKDENLASHPRSMREEGNMQGKQTTYYEWDSSGRIQSVKTKKWENRYQYDEQGNLKQKEDWRAGRLYRTTRYTSTPDGKLLREDVQEEKDSWTTFYEYDARGLLVKDSTSNKRWISSYFYNDANVLVKYEVYKDGALLDSMRYFYDDKGHWVRTLRAQFSEEFVCSYNEQGLVIYDANQSLNMWRKYSYNADGRLIKSWSGYNDTVEEETTYTYDSRGSLIYESSKSLSDSYNNGETIWMRRSIEYWDE